MTEPTRSTQVWELAERMQGDIAREIRVLLGEEKYDPRIFTDAERERRVHALKLCADESTDAAARHRAWMTMHTVDGWTYGPEFNPAIKQHPNLKPWDELPQSTRSKAEIFAIVARYAAQIAALP
jgi:RyR domain